MRLLKSNILPCLFTLALIIPLSGCLTLKSDTPPPAIYRIKAQPAAVPIDLNIKKTTVLLVREPEMPAGFSSNNMVLHFDSGRRQEYYAGALWASDLSDLIQQFIIDDARQSFPSLVLDSLGSGLESDYVLSIDVLDFQPVYEGEPAGIPVLKSRVRFTLTGGTDDALLTDIIITREQKAAENNLSVITAGLEEQLQGIVAEAFQVIAKKIK